MFERLDGGVASTLTLSTSVDTMMEASAQFYLRDGFFSSCHLQN